MLEDPEGIWPGLRDDPPLFVALKVLRLTEGSQ